MTNHFEQAGEEGSKFGRQKVERQAIKSSKPPMVAKGAEKAVRERSAQMKFFRQWKRQIKQNLLSGEHAADVTQLLRLVRRLPEPELLVRFVRNAKWLQNGSQLLRDAALDYIDHAISRWRVRHGMSTFDDGLPGEFTPFVVIRHLLIQTPNDNPELHTRRNRDVKEKHEVLNP